MRMRSVLKELGVSKQQVTEYCKKRYPHLFHKQTYIPLKDWRLEDSKGVEVEFCEVSFKDLLLMYLSDHNFKVTGEFASNVKGW